MNITREQAHNLIDRMPESQLASLVQFLETIVDPAIAALRRAETEDEEIGKEEEQAVRKARVWLRKNGGRGIPHDEAMRRLGI
jgi:hypothetical protein